jgi:hypothetical protein
MNAHSGCPKRYDLTGIDFEAHDMPAGQVDGEARGVVSAVNPSTCSITISEVRDCLSGWFDAAIQPRLRGFPATAGY